MVSAISARDGDDRFLDELFETAQRADAGAGVDRADAAGMAGAPGFEEVERSGRAPRRWECGRGAGAATKRTEIGKRRHAVFVRMATRLGAAHCSSRVSSMMTTRSAVFATSASSALVSVVLPVLPPRKDVGAGRDGATATRPDRGHDPAAT